ncbi:hypothetical protein BDQ17DRAFT_1405435 [Cyathus striatus]|nr:hypothetical protein BDQ17DRAFT_1405435 [Cyathus striatus]
MGSSSLSISSALPHNGIPNSAGSDITSISLPAGRNTTQVPMGFVQYGLNSGEKHWQKRYNFLLQRGYRLRSRYNPNWKPSWTGTNVVAGLCEDSIVQLLPVVLDATRITDGSAVCLKLIENKPDEVRIAQYLYSENLRHHPNNHCVPALDAFNDNFSLTMSFLVMPILRPFNDPEFGTIPEIVDFVSQILEGLMFMHDNLVAHGDCTGANVMMDAHSILPHGWHFIADNCAPDGFTPIKPLSRSEHSVRYLFIDFGLSHRYLPGESRYVHDAGGRDSEVPELARDGPWDLYKIDVFTVGNMFYHDLLEVYTNLDFLRPLITFMKHPDPQARFDAQQSLKLWNSIKNSLSLGSRWRLQKRDETVGERVVLNTVDMAMQGIHQIRRLFKDETKSWSPPP